MDASIVLEFDKIRNILINYAKLEINKDRFLKLEMINDKEMINLMLDKTKEFYDILLEYGVYDLYEINDISLSASLARKGMTLSIKELSNILESLKIILEIKKYSMKIDSNKYPLYFEIINNLTFIDILYRELTKVIGKDFKILDSASLKLKKIRSEISSLNNEIKVRLNKIIASNKYMLTDTNIIYRNNKQLLAVSESYKYSLGGIIHGESSSHQTFYVEPEEVYRISLKINKLEDEEKEEIERILVYLSQYVSSYEDDIINNHNALIEIDYNFSKAKYARLIKGKKANISSKINLVGARHPLILENKVVSNDFILNAKDGKILVISGPNSGGKSVCLKTLGLLAYMNQCGLLISVDKESSLPIFDNIYLDLGDNQSIQDSLSTFSSHISNIKDILELATSDSLVLLDELASGTEPRQGEAIAMALLDKFNEIGCYLMITTHFDNVKTFALENEYLRISAMEFDDIKLKPTYRLVYNSMGKSYGFEVCKIYGIGDKIIDKAIKYKDRYSNVNELALSKLEKESERVRLLELENKDLALKLENELRVNKEKNKNLDDLIKDIHDNANIEKERLVNEQIEIIDEMLKDIRNKEEVKMHELLNAKHNLEKLLKEEEREKSESVFEVGDYVYVKSLNIYADVIKKNKDNYVVSNGKISLSLKNSDLEKKEKTNNKNKVAVSNRVKTKVISNELNVIGKTSLEAIFEVEKFLDLARIRNLSPVRIIHGYGEGILKKAIHDYLKKCDFVLEFSLASYSQGMGGATMVYLKRGK